MFTPSAVTIFAGTRVRWTWGAGATSHSVESTGAGATSFTSSAVMTGAGSVYTFTFLNTGVYPYDCVIHGVAMQGTVTVN